MADIGFDSYYATVMEHAEALSEWGYRLGASEFEHVLEFTKTIGKGISCTIGFQWIPHGILPTSEFKVWVRRLRSTEESDNAADYINLQMDLRNLLKGAYERDPLPNDHPGYWVFQTQDELARQLEEVQPLIIDYGIPWLEDPKSNMDWLSGRLGTH